MAQRVQIKRGTRAGVPTAAMLAGELHHAQDRGTLHIATDATTTLSVVPAIDELTAMGAVDSASDELVIRDASAAGVQARRISVDALKTAMNIPAASSDELVAVISGGTSGYLWGTDGTDGVLRMSSSMAWTKDASNGFVTLEVGTIDCGTF